MTIKTTINSYDHEGRGIGKIDNKIIFVPSTLKDEEIECQITSDKKNYMEGNLINIIKESPHRIKSICPYYNKCGGCSYLHMDIVDEELLKVDIVKNIFKKYTNLDIKPLLVSSNKEYNYRNKIELKINNYKWGYLGSKSHDFTPIDYCYLAKESINDLIKDNSLFNIKDGSIIIRSNYNNELLIKIDTKGNYSIDIDKLTNKHKIIGIIVNDKIIYGEDYYIERIGGYLFKVNINSFFQINLDILEKVFKLIKNVEFNNVIDLYCGVGVLGIASKSNKVYGIEIIPEAVKDAIKNSKLNKQDNLYLLGDSSKIKEIKDNIDGLIIDPPRSGLNKETLSNIIDIKPNNIFYMSCNPLTLARDINILKEYYDIYKVYILNMFPRTKHCESIVILERN